MHTESIIYPSRTIYVVDFAAAALPRFNFSITFFLPSVPDAACDWITRGWLDDESEDSEDVALGNDGVSFLGGLSENDRLTGGGIGAGAVLIPFIWLAVIVAAES